MMTHRALLKNELLKHSIIDIRVCFSFISFCPIILMHF
jgi:hypothetical protein